jgi:hypothetical protein
VVENRLRNHDQFALAIFIENEYKNKNKKSCIERYPSR